MVFGRGTAATVAQKGTRETGVAPEAAGSKPSTPSVKDRVSVLLLVNIVLGIGVLVLSAAAAVLNAQGGKLSV